MRIVYAKMPGYGWTSTPSDAVARELEKQGHIVALVDTFDYIPQGEFDFVWSPYESATILGDYISRKLKIPHFAHIETIPPWRIFDGCDVENYGLTKDSPEVKVLQQNKAYYSQVIQAYERAHIHTISNQVRLPLHEQLMPSLKGKLKLRYPSIDVSSIEVAKRMFNPSRNPYKVITVSRATEIKRYDILVDVMNKVSRKVIWTIVGEGPMLEYVHKNVSNKNITLDFKGALWCWQRYYEMMSATCMVYTMGAMPPVEAALLGCAPVCIEQQRTKHIPEFDKFLSYNFGDSMPIFNNGEIEPAAKEIDDIIQHGPQVTLDKWRTIDKFLSGKINVTPAMVNAANIIKVYEKCS